MSSSKFDLVEYIKKLRNVGMTQEFAELQAQELGHALESVLEKAKEANDHTDLATKADLAIVKVELQKEIKGLEVRLMTRLMTIYGAGFLILLGVLAKGFHWL